MSRLRVGFTLIEIMITLVVMTILMTLAVVIVGNIQSQARDSEREQDVEAIARGLEQRYNLGNSKVIGWQTKGSYPGYNEFIHAVDGWNWCDNKSDVFSPCSTDGNGYSTEWLSGTTDEVFHAPSEDGHFVSLWGATPDPATQRAQYLDEGNYVYEALDSNNQPCYDAGCVKFNLYYKKETDGQVIQIKSKHQ